MLPKYRPDELCGDPEWQVPHLFTDRTGPGGVRERRCEYCGIPGRNLEVANVLPALGTAAAILVVCALLPRIAALLERIAIAVESQK